MTLDAKFQVATGWYWKETDGVLFLCQYGAHATANGWLWVSTAFHGLDRVWYIPPTDPRPRYEEQVAPQNQSCTACAQSIALDRGCRAINRASSGNYWKPPISCREQSAAACNRVDLSIVLHCICTALHSVQRG